MCPVPLMISRDVHLYLSQTSICQEVTRERENERNEQEGKERVQKRTKCGLKREKERRNRRRNGRKLVLWEEAEEWFNEEVRIVLKNIFSRKGKKGRRKTSDEQEKK